MSLFPTSFTASLDDVVFEGRNQAYGAYQLRQDYQQHLASAGGITLGICALLLLSWMGWQRLAPNKVEGADGKITCYFPAEPIKVEIERAKQAVTAPPRAARAVPTHPAPTAQTTVAKDQDVALTPPRPTPAPETDGPTGPAVAGPATPGLAESGPASDPSDGSETGPETAPAVVGPYIVVEKMPEFAGGQAALLRYLQKNLHYPAQALRDQIEGKVFLSFVVQADGHIADVTILKGLGYGLDEEAQRVVRQMPTWTPGYQSHHAVPVRFTLPITFKFQ